MTSKKATKGVIERDFAQRWYSTVHHMREAADRMQAAVDAIPPEPVPQADGDVRALLTKQMVALLDHTVALNCLSVLMLDNSGR